MIFWAVTTLFVAFLFLYEAWALATKHRTITDEVRDANAGFVMLPFLAGLVIGGLAVHFLRWF